MPRTKKLRHNKKNKSKRSKKTKKKRLKKSSCAPRKKDDVLDYSCYYVIMV